MIVFMIEMIEVIIQKEVFNVEKGKYRIGTAHL